MRLELTNTGFAIRRLSRLATRATWERKPGSAGIPACCLTQGSTCVVIEVGAEGEIRTLEASLEDSHVSSYITSAKDTEGAANRRWQLAMLEPPIGLEPTPNSFEANRSSIKLRGRRELEHRTGVEPVSRRWQRRVLKPSGPTMLCYRTASGSDRSDAQPLFTKTSPSYGNDGSAQSRGFASVEHDDPVATAPGSVTLFWSGRTESNCHHEFPGLGCNCHYTTPRNEKDEGGGMKDESRIWRRPFHPSSFRLHPLTQTTCLISATISTRSS